MPVPTVFVAFSIVLICIMIDIVKSKVKPSRVDDEASALFDMVDYQCPETLASELEYDA